MRVIAATNRDLERDVSEGRFRRDLYFRLRVLEILVPPLRKRPDDINELAATFCNASTPKPAASSAASPPKPWSMLCEYRWPGNVRELKNVVERAVVLGPGRIHRAGDLTLSQIGTAGDTGDVPAAAAQRPVPHFAGRHGTPAHHGHACFHRLEQESNGHLLGIERSTLDRKIRRYEIIEEPRRGAISQSPPRATCRTAQREPRPTSGAGNLARRVRRKKERLRHFDRPSLPPSAGKDAIAAARRRDSCALNARPLTRARQPSAASQPSLSGPRKNGIRLPHSRLDACGFAARAVKHPPRGVEIEDPSNHSLRLPAAGSAECACWPPWAALRPRRINSGVSTKAIGRRPRAAGRHRARRAQ